MLYFYSKLLTFFIYRLKQIKQTDLFYSMSFYINIVQKNNYKKNFLNVIERTNRAKQKRLEPCIIKKKLIMQSLFLELKNPNLASKYVSLGPD